MMCIEWRLLLNKDFRPNALPRHSCFKSGPNASLAAMDIGDGSLDLLACWRLPGSGFSDKGSSFLLGVNACNLHNHLIVRDGAHSPPKAGDLAFHRRLGADGRLKSLLFGPSIVKKEEKIKNHIIQKNISSFANLSFGRGVSAAWPMGTTTVGTIPFGK